MKHEEEEKVVKIEGYQIIQKQEEAKEVRDGDWRTFKTDPGLILGIDSVYELLEEDPEHVIITTSNSDVQPKKLNPPSRLTATTTTSNGSTTTKDEAPLIQNHYGGEGILEVRFEAPTSSSFSAAGSWCSFKDRCGGVHQYTIKSVPPNTRVYACPNDPDCPFTTEYKNRLVTHYNTTHLTKSPLETTTTASTESVAAPSTPVIITTTKRSFEDRLGNVNSTIRSDDELYTCPACTFKRAKFNEVKRHYNLRHTDQYLHRCQYCATLVRLEDAITLSKHVQSCHVHDEKCLHTFIPNPPPEES